MRTRTALVAMAVVFGLGWSANRVFSQDGGMEPKKAAEEKPAPAGPSPEEMAAWEKSMTPGEPHRKMAAQEGSWDSAGKMWMAPDQPPSETKGSAKLRMIFGGRYQIQEYAGEMMGMPFEGMSITGYDNVKQKYFSTWIDSMGTGVLHCEGTADEKGNLTFHGVMADPMTGKDLKVRMAYPCKDKDSIAFEMYMDDGKGKGEMKAMEMTYTRRK